MAIRLSHALCSRSIGTLRNLLSFTPHGVSLIKNVRGTNRSLPSGPGAYRHASNSRSYLAAFKTRMHAGVSPFIEQGFVLLFFFLTSERIYGVVKTEVS